MKELYIGLMSGTSADGIDAALVSYQQEQPILLKTHYHAYDSALRTKILNLCQAGENEIFRCGELDYLLGKAFAAAVKDLCQKANVCNTSITAVGSHGQTVRHHPNHAAPFTLQIGDPNIIAYETGITTVADFRRKDMAAGGQGAPLVPAFHQAMFSSKTTDRAIVNIGGIANVTILPSKDEEVIGFDTGPGNVLIDEWIYQQQQKNYDADGNWGAQGRIDASLLQKFLADPYFKLQPPKSTGREYFNSHWLDQHLHQTTIKPADVQATLVELTAVTILNAIRNYFSAGEIFICGGGAHNGYLLSRLQILADKQFTIKTTNDIGINADWVEAMAFAWLARQRVKQLPGNLPQVTGAKKAMVLGSIYLGN